MSRTAAGVRTGPAARLAELGRQRPEWEAWLGLLQEVERVTVQSPVASRQLEVGGESRVESHQSRVEGSPEAPLLHGHIIRVDGAELKQLIGRLASMASDLEGGTSLRNFRVTAEEAMELVGAAVRQDRDAIGALAAARELDAGALASVIYLAALPPLRSLGRTLQGEIPQHWPHGYCPVCAAWPLLAERRGLDRSRRLRCGRCAAEWEVEWLTCVYCGERDHQQLGSLVLENAGETLKVETCATCHGYLKSVATLQAIPAFELLLRDLETVELDLVALERGFARPEKSGFELQVRVV
jgi:FdhE protein